MTIKWKIFNIEIFLVFTQNQLNTILNVLSLSAYNDVVAIEGVLNLINNAETMVYDPSFQYTADTLRNDYIFGM